MRIGILGTRGIPNNYGGFEQFAQYLSLGLAQRGHEVSVYSSSLHSYKENYWNGVEIIHRKDWENKIGTAGQFIYDLNCINDSRKRNFDVLLHLGYTSDSIWHWRWPKRAINMVNMDGLEWKRSKYNKPTQRFLKYAESLAVKNADWLIADSIGIKKYLVANYGRTPEYIPYGAEIFGESDPSVPGKYRLNLHQYFLLIARMEPENNIEMIIRGHLASRHPYPLLVMGNITNKFGKYITSTYTDPTIHYSDAVYDQAELNNLRYYSTMYFHGHSVGGTNPSLIEAMACGCRIAAHNNRFNRAVLQEEADYFPTVDEVTQIITEPKDNSVIAQWKKLNIEKIRKIYNHDKIIDDYEDLMIRACREKAMIMHPVMPRRA
jgi:glycosyltransferase involved in cell wall biosynthesis